MLRNPISLPIPCLLLAFFLFSFQEKGCHRRKTDGTAMQTATQPRTSDFLREKLKTPSLKNLNRLAARAHILMEEEGGSTVEANANLIWVRDSAIWLNVKKFGIEAVRALIRPDTVFVLNRLEKTCSVRSVSTLERQYGLPGGFAALQQALLGQATLLPEIALQADIAEGLHRLRGSTPAYAADYRIEEGAWRLRRESFIQQREQRTVVLDFEQFEKMDGAAGGFPYLRRIEAFSPDSGRVRFEIQLSDLEINVPKTMRFDIPDHYERTR